MNSFEQKAVIKLGWTPDSWDAGEDSVFHTSWEQLGPSRQQDAVALGFDAPDFGSGNADDHGQETTRDPTIEDPIPEESPREEVREPTGPVPVFKGFALGDKVQVYSKSAQSWVDAEVDKLHQNGHVQVAYNRAGTGMRKTPRMCDLRVHVEIEDEELRADQGSRCGSGPGLGRGSRGCSCLVHTCAVCNGSHAHARAHPTNRSRVVGSSEPLPYWSGAENFRERSKPGGLRGVEATHEAHPHAR